MDIEKPDCGKNIESEGPFISRFLVLDFEERAILLRSDESFTSLVDAHSYQNQTNKDKSLRITHKETTFTKQRKGEALDEEPTK